MNNKLGGKKPHKTKSQRKLITIQEWADFLGVNRPTIYKYLEAYQKESGN
jgi:predicted DNA-binding transcriptional regulator AlpA